jgi:hypothetical protein
VKAFEKTGFAGFFFFCKEISKNLLHFDKKCGIIYCYSVGVFHTKSSYQEWWRDRAL